MFKDNGIQYASPFVNMAEPEMVPKQMYDCLKDVFDIDMAVWLQYLPIDDDLLGWLFGEETQAKKIRSPLDISDVWTSSNSSNTNEILWGAKFATRFPWITCVLRLSSYECGMDQPTYTPTQKIVEATGTLFFKFGDLDSTKPAGSIRIRIETIVHYLAKYL